MSSSNAYPANDRSFRPMHYSPTLLSAIYHGIENTKLVEVEYESKEKGTTIRIVEPMSIMLKNGKKHLVGWCRLRNDYRTFIVDRLTTVKVKSETFERRPDFDESIFLRDFNQVAVESGSET